MREEAAWPRRAASGLFLGRVGGWEEMSQGLGQAQKWAGDRAFALDFRPLPHANLFTKLMSLFNVLVGGKPGHGAAGIAARLSPVGP